MPISLTPLAWHRRPLALLAASFALLAAAVLPLAWTGGSAPSVLTQSATPAATSIGSIAATHPTRQVEVVVQLNSRVRWDSGRELLASYGGRVTRDLHIIRGYGARMTAVQAQRLAADPSVKALTLNYEVTPSRVANPNNVNTAFLQSTRVDKLWENKPWATGEGVTVAVVDTGIDGDLPDFRAADGSSRVIASVAVHPDATNEEDGYGHGTHVAGLLAGNGAYRDAGDPLQGRYSGVAPEAKLVNVKVSDDHGNTSVLDVIYGLQFVVDHQDEYGIRVVNLSLNSSIAQSYKVDPLDAAVESAWFHGMVVVTAAGNRGGDADAVNYAPANDPYVITVGAVDDQNTKSYVDDFVPSWSSHGTTQDGHVKPEVMAPGAHMVGPLAPGSDFASMCPTCVVRGQYIRLGGTSMAAPMVAGIAADLLSMYPGAKPNQIKGTIMSGTRATIDGQPAVNAWGASLGVSLVSNVGLTPNPLVDAATGNIDYSRASWSRASWSRASWSRASWSRASWSCDCLGSLITDPADPTRASWSRASWSRASWSRASWSTSFGL